MSPTLLEDYAHVRSREPDSPTSNVEVLQLVEEMVRAPGSHNWAVHSSGTLSPGESEESYYLIISGSEPTEPSQRIAFLAGDDFFDIGYDPDGTVEWDEEEDFTHDGAFSGLRTLAGSDQELVDGELQPASLNLDDFGSIRVWLAEHREINDCGSPCSVGRAASITLLIEKLESNEADNSFIYGAHVGRVLSRMDLNDEEKGIFGDAVLVGKPTVPSDHRSGELITEFGTKSWLGQPISTNGSVVRTGLTDWQTAAAFGWPSDPSERLLPNVNSKKRLIPYSVHSVEDGPDFQEFVQVVTSGRHTLALKLDGTMWSWGLNDNGQLGRYPTNKYPNNVPGPVLLNKNWTKVATGDSHSLAIDSDGKLWSFGSNFYSQLGIGSDAILVSNVFIPQKINNDTDWIDVGCGISYSLALKNNGKMFTCGTNITGVLGLNENNVNFKVNSFTEITNPSKTWTKISAGPFHCLASTNEPAVYSWGWNFNGRTGLDTDEGNTIRPTQLAFYNEIIENKIVNLIQAGDNNSFIVADNQSLYAFGRNSNYQLGFENNNFQGILGLVRNDLVILQIAAGSTHTLIRTEDDQIYWCGKSDQGQLGFSNEDPIIQFQEPGISANFISAALNSTLILNDTFIELNGTVFLIKATGKNEFGQLGLGDEIDRNSFTVNPYYLFYSNLLSGLVGRTKYLRQFGTEPLDHGVKFVTTTELSLQAWLPLGNGSNQLILWRRGDNNDEQDPDDGEE